MLNISCFLNVLFFIFFSQASFGKNVRYTLGLSKMSWSDALLNKAYQNLYTSDPIVFSFQSDWAYFQNEQFQLSMGVRLGYSKKEGKTALKSSDFTSTLSQIQIDKDGNTAITFMPLDFVLGGQIFFDSKRIIGLQMQGGIEQLFYEEFRLLHSDKDTGVSTPSDKNINSKRILTRKTIGIFIFEVGLPINLIPIFPSNERSLFFMGFQDVLIMPLWRFGKKIDGLAVLGKESKADFSYTEYGVSFVFQ